MPIDLSSATNVKPAAAPVTGGEQQASVDMSAATPVAPVTAPANALDPLSGAGVSLTRLVLGIMSGALLLLICALIYQEKKFSDLTNESFRLAVMTLAESPGDASTRFEPVLYNLQLAEKDTSPAKAQPLLTEAATKLHEAAGRTINNTELAALVTAVDELAQRSEKGAIDAAAIHAVLSKVQAVSKSLNQPPATAEQLKARQDLLKAHLEAANATREFWSRMAQMFLLNLLLPILTALLGYVFASKAASR